MVDGAIVVECAIVVDFAIVVDVIVAAIIQRIFDVMVHCSVGKLCS